MYVHEYMCSLDSQYVAYNNEDCAAPMACPGFSIPFR